MGKTNDDFKICNKEQGQIEILNAKASVLKTVQIDDQNSIMNAAATVSPSSTEGQYTVNIFAYISNYDTSKCLLTYRGVVDAKTSINNGENITCRDFDLFYDCDSKSTEYNLYHIEFDYKILDDSSAEAILVEYTEDNLEKCEKLADPPKTDRGTVVSITKPKNP